MRSPVDRGAECTAEEVERELSRPEGNCTRSDSVRRMHVCAPFRVFSGMDDPAQTREALKVLDRLAEMSQEEWIPYLDEVSRERRALEPELWALFAYYELDEKTYEHL